MRYILHMTDAKDGAPRPYVWSIVDTTTMEEIAVVFSSSPSKAPNYLRKRQRILNDADKRKGDKP